MEILLFTSHRGLWKSYKKSRPSSWQRSEVSQGSLLGPFLQRIMSFRKRNVGISGPSSRIPPSAVGNPPVSQDATHRATAPKPTAPQIPGVRPSPLDGRPTTSTGTPSLDGLLAGFGGLALGNSILLEETGTTDYAGTLLRYYAAEGVVQGHMVHVVGVGEHWRRELPGLVGASDGIEHTESRKRGVEEKMKIAWRYEGLGEFGAGRDGLRGGSSPYSHFVHLYIDQYHGILSIANRYHAVIVDRAPNLSTPSGQDQSVPKPFCHTFDLTKRLALPSPTAINFIPLRQSSSQASPFTPIVQALSQQLSSSSPNATHRLVIPSLLSPAFYPAEASSPQHILQFLHILRSLLRRYPTQLTAMISLPLTLYPRSTGLVRWMEIVSDGVLELVPFPHTIDLGPSLTTSGAATAQEEKPQGMVKIHCLPVFHERGGGGLGGAGVGDDLAFTVSRRKFVIKPFSLPPVEGDTLAQRGEVEGGKATKVDIDF